MADRESVAKKPEAKREIPASQKQQTAHFQPVSSPVDHILFLQRTAGNQAVQGLISSGVLQTKLRVGPPRDRYEEEADKVAEEAAALKKHPLRSGYLYRTGQYTPLDEKKKRFQRKTGSVSGAVDVSIARSHIRYPTSGEPLNTSTRRSLESYTGADLGSVRVHNDSTSHAAASALNARAFTYREHIWLGRGESHTDLRLMAHEVTHVLQQGAAVQRVRVDVTPAAPSVQRGLLDFVGDVKDKLLEKASQWVENIPGFHLLTVILGRNPVTDKPVERNAVNLIRGFLGLVPGGEMMFQNLQRSGAIEQAFTWLNDQIAKLNLTWEYAKSLFKQAWDMLSATDIFNPGKAIEKLKAVFGPPLERIKNFATAVGKKIVEFVFEGVLKLAGPLGAKVLGVVKRAGDIFSVIINDPIRFIGYLIQAVRKGFDLFSTNILAHLKEGLMKWLFGALSGAGLRLPEKFDLRGILSLVLQILALTYDRLRSMLVKVLGEKPVAYIEKTFEFLSTLVTKGLAAAWEKLVEFMGDLKEMVLGAIRDWVVVTIVKKAITKLVSMFNPAGAVIQAIVMVYDTVKFFIERFQQIVELVNSIFESIASIASGKIEAAAGYVEKTMSRTIPVIVGFLASLIGLGGISEKIRGIIKGIQARVEGALLKLVDFIVSKAKMLLGKGKEIGKAAIGKIVEWWRTRIKFSTEEGEEHSLYFQGEERSARLIVATTPVAVETFINNREVEINSPASTLSPDEKERVSVTIGEARAIIGKIKQLTYPSDRGAPAPTAELRQVNELVAQLSQKLKLILVRSGAVPPMTVAPGFSSSKASGLAVRYLFNDPGNHQPGEDAGKYKGDLGGSLTVLKSMGIRTNWVAFHILSWHAGGLAVDSNLIPAPRDINDAYNGEFEEDFKTKYKGGKVLWLDAAVDYYGDNPNFVERIRISGGLMKYKKDKWIEDKRSEAKLKTFSKRIALPQSATISINRIPADPGERALVLRGTRLTEAMVNIILTHVRTRIRSKEDIIGIMKNYVDTLEPADREKRMRDYIKRINETSIDFTS